MSDSETSVAERLTQLVALYENGKKAGFARAVGITAQGVGDLLKGAKGGPSFAVLQNILMAYSDVREEWLLFGRGPMLKSQEAPRPLQAMPGESDEKVLVVDQEGNALAPIINYKVAASYNGYQSQEYFEQLDTLSLPPMLVKRGRHMVFPVIGDSMEPTIQDKDYVLCKYIPKSEWQYINKSTVCVIVSTTHGLQLKRLTLEPHRQIIRCRSDNKRHLSYVLEWEEVLEIWQFEWRLTSCADDVTENVFEKVDNLEDAVQDLRVLVEGLIEQQERSQRRTPKNPVKEE